MAGGGAGTNGGWIDGSSAAAAFKEPFGAAVDASGNVLVADWGNHRLRRLTPIGCTQLQLQLVVELLFCEQFVSQVSPAN